MTVSKTMALNIILLLFSLLIYLRDTLLRKTVVSRYVFCEKIMLACYTSIKNKILSWVCLSSLYLMMQVFCGFSLSPPFSSPLREIFCMRATLKSKENLQEKNFVSHSISIVGYNHVKNTNQNSSKSF